MSEGWSPRPSSVQSGSVVAGGSSRVHTSTGGQGATGGQLLPLCWPDTPAAKPPGHHHAHQRQPFNPPGTAQPPPTDCLGAVWVGLSSGRSCAPGGGCALPVLVCLLSLLSWLVVPELLLLTRRAAALPHYNSSTGGTPTPSAPPTTHLGKTQNMTWGRCELCGECFR